VERGPYLRTVEVFTMLNWKFYALWALSLALGSAALISMLAASG